MSNVKKKKCKYCASMIPEEAIICPQCRKRVKGINGCLLSFLIFIAFWFILGILASILTPMINSFKKVSNENKIDIEEEKYKCCVSHGGYYAFGVNTCYYNPVSEESKVMLEYIYWDEEKQICAK